MNTKVEQRQPWSIHPDFPARIIAGSHHLPVESEYMGNLDEGDSVEKAAHIVRCVNTHAEMLSALQGVNDALMFEGPCAVCAGSNESGHEEHCPVLKIRFALANATA